MDNDTFDTLGYSLKDCSDDEEKNFYSLRQQVSQLKEVSVKIGDELRQQSTLTDEMEGNMYKLKDALNKSTKRVMRIYKKHTSFYNFVLAFFALLAFLYLRMTR